MLRDSAKSLLGLTGGLLLVLTFSLWLRFPLISTGLPYFYNEDEAHHFNRTVEMLQSGDLNPHYFLKPSLHFYLRLPVTALAYAVLHSRGELNNLKDVRTRDSQGISGYSFTASHPTLVKWNRAFSVALILTSIAMLALLTRRLTGNNSAALSAALLAGVTPALVSESAVVGVDALVVCFAITAAYFAYLCLEKYSPLILGLATLFAGLTVASKYNAAPIACLPLLALYLGKNCQKQRVLAAMLLPILVFAACSPFIFVELPLFIEHVRFEIWHYRVAGHVGHTAEPGLDQFLFYTNWFLNSGFGYLPLGLAVLGAVRLFRLQRNASLLLLAYPLLFFILMCAQRANFTRNMLGVLPFLALLAGYAIVQFSSQRKQLHYPSVILLLILALLQPIRQSYDIRQAALNSTDTRNTAKAWLEENILPDSEVALAGDLQLPLFQITINNQTTRTFPGIQRLGLDKFSVLKLYQKGYDYLFVGPSVTLSTADLALLQKRYALPGSFNPERAIKDPAIVIYSINENSAVQALLTDQSSLPELETCEQPQVESHCWLTARLSRLNLPATKAVQDITVSLNAHSPWPGQLLQILNSQGTALCEFDLNTTARVFNCSVTKKDLTGPAVLFIKVQQIHSPASFLNSSDRRRLGAAYNDLKITVK